MVACCRDVGGRCIKARGLPGLSQQPGAVTEPLKLGRDARKTGPGDQGPRDARPGEPTRNRRAGQRHRQSAPNCSSRWPSIAAAPGHSKALQDAPSPWLLALTKEKKKGREKERKETRKKTQICHRIKKEGGQGKKKSQASVRPEHRQPSRSVGRAMRGCAPKRPRVVTEARMLGQAQ